MALSTATSLATPRVRFYREFLTPALHRRFVKAAGVLLIVCFVEGVVARIPASIFWLLFPLGRTGAFALLLSISALIIFLLRLTHLHFGQYITQSPASTIATTFFSAEAAQALVFYAASAWWFGEVYLWTTPEEYGIVVEGRPYERPRVNEWPIYLRCHFIFLALVETCFHLSHDGGRVQLPLPGLPADKKRATTAPAPLEQVRAMTGTLLWGSFKVAVSTAVLSPFVYYFTVRAFAWDWAVSIVRIFWSVAKSIDTPASLPFHYTVLIKSFVSGTMLLFLWRMSNFAFGAFVAIPPVRGSKTISDDSKDPNGSLLLGLKSKKQLVREFAFWELNCISISDEARRLTIFKELDRKTGSTWSQILDASLEPIKAISERIADCLGPTPEAKAAQVKNVASLPKVSAPLQDGQVLQVPFEAKNTTQAVKSIFGDLAKSISDPSSPSPLQTVYSFAQQQLGPQVQKVWDMDGVIRVPTNITIESLRGSVAYLFQDNPVRRASMVIFGLPRSDLRPILLSIDSITNLALRALKEDQYGTVCKDIPRILRSLTNTASTIQKFLLEPSVGIKIGSWRTDGDIDLLLCFLREALRAILDGYEQYGSDIGLGPVEVREVQKAARPR